jgi:hypothetical protein
VFHDLLIDVFIDPLDDFRCNFGSSRLPCAERYRDFLFEDSRNFKHSVSERKDIWNLYVHVKAAEAHKAKVRRDLLFMCVHVKAGEGHKAKVRNDNGYDINNRY